MRLFIAIKLSREMVQTLTDAQCVWKQQVGGNYPARENLHLTLAFIGDYHAPEIILETMKQTAFTPFPLTLDGHVGTFGDLWWAGLQQEPRLFSLVETLRQALQDRQIPFDGKAFVPHITLLRRAKVPASSEIKPTTWHLEQTSMTVSGISLMNSQRENGKLIYQELGFVKAEQEETSWILSN